jgi:hypothetical protein
MLLVANGCKWHEEGNGDQTCPRHNPSRLIAMDCLDPTPKPKE